MVRILEPTKATEDLINQSKTNEESDEESSR